MLLSRIWAFFFIGGFLATLYRFFLIGDKEIFKNLIEELFKSADTGFTLALGLTGVMTFWLGLMKVGEKAGVVEWLARVSAPFFSKLFPSIPNGHPAMGAIIMNFSANMLGLDNAATPLGLKAMNALQEINPKKDEASDAQIMFLVLNASGLTIIPISIIFYRYKMGAVNPTDVFLPILIATFISTVVALVALCIRQKISLFQMGLILPVCILSLLIFGAILLVQQLPAGVIQYYASLGSNIILLLVILAFITVAVVKSVEVFDVFIEGAKEGFITTVKIIPYLVAMLAAIGMFRNSGALVLLTDGVGWLVGLTGLPNDFVAALPTGILKPLSGSGSRAMMLDTMRAFGPDSFAGKLSCMMQGAADTTFYIIAVYFGSVGISKTRYAVKYGLLADFTGVIAAIFLAYLFF
jgi:spore maturation protein SpmA